MWKLCLWIEWLFLTSLLTITSRTHAQVLRQTRVPYIKDKPFISFWNAPTAQCKLRYKVDLDLSVFDIVANTNETLSGSNVTIFYHTHLGYYPYITDDGHSFNGGVPQNESLKRHLKKAELDIEKLIPCKKFTGLGVIDWENWRPQWDRNWGNKTIYRNKSIELVKAQHPDWSDAKLSQVAKKEFDQAADNFMTETIIKAQNVRPHGLWGYYLFPDCYNYDYKTHPHAFTGKCPDIELKRNDMLLWMWKSVNALYPSIYLDYVLKSSPNALKFVHHRVKEAMRVASMARKDYDLPVFVYSRPFYAYTFHVLTEVDLVKTIGESAALGAAGIVLWGGMDYASTKESCNTVKKYVDGPLGHYIVNVTSAAKLCSKVLCKMNGRCIRKHVHSTSYLHLNPNNYEIKKRSPGWGHSVTGSLGEEDILYMKQKFVCQCYEGWIGISCELPKSGKLNWKRNDFTNGSGKIAALNIVFYAVFQICILLQINA
ncbi:hyaluronidase-1-like [Pelobates fuscus]|uniref:hyaluronidase-1-like n=1 Tax=Pelobates fuscus TaxID=191477 RepID=UPI002FE482F6